jgi:glycosyltransferase involved in cell wall biosynthesis
LKGLAISHEITLLTFADDEHIKNQSELNGICRSVSILPKKKYDAGSKRALLGYLGRKPRVLADLYDPEMDLMIQDEISNGNHDLVIASEIYMADYLDHVSSIPMIFEEAEIGVFTDAAKYSDHLFQRARNQLTLIKLRSYFDYLLPKFLYCTVVSNTEKNLLQNLVPDYHSVEVIPNGVNLADYEDQNQEPKPGQIIFSGSLTFSPNHQAMLWFTDQVFPNVLDQYPAAQLVITGNHGGRKLPNARNVSFTGYVDRVQPLIASSWISLAPIFSGGGTRLKILEAFGLRSAVISTTKGAEGLEVEHEKHLLIADTPQAFAQETKRLLNDADLRQDLVSNAYRLVSQKYDWDVILPKLLSLVEDAGTMSRAESAGLSEHLPVN